MKLKDLKGYIYDKVSVYTQKNDSLDEFEDLYNGEMQDIPDELLNCDIHLIGAKRNKIVDICIKLNK